MEFGHRSPKTSNGEVCEEGKENITNLSALFPSIKMSVISDGKLNDHTSTRKKNAIVWQFKGVIYTGPFEKVAKFGRVANRLIEKLIRCPIWELDAKTAMWHIWSGI